MKYVIRDYSLETSYSKNMAAEIPSSFIHCEDAIGPLSNFTEVSFKRFIECRRQCLNLDGHKKDIALKTTRTISYA